MDGETGAEDLFRLRQLAVFAQLLGERKKESALRIRFDPELQFLDFGGYAGLSHVLKSEFCSTTGGGATSAAEKNRPKEGRFGNFGIETLLNGSCRSRFQQR